MPKRASKQRRAPAPGTNLTVVGTQWGDEGKGKVVDHLSRRADLVARCQGGPNAGHTVCTGQRTIVLHQIPTGILNRGVDCVIGCGCVVDPYVFNEELAAVRRWRVPLGRRLHVDRRAHMIMPWHRQLDRVREERAGTRRIGTTGRGIGPVYQDKYTRVGIRAEDLLSEDRFRERMKRNLAAANFELMERHKSDPLPFKKTADDYWHATRGLARRVADGSALVEEALAGGKRVLFEGAQGVQLDIDLGSYPFVTTSSTGAWGVPPGLGISPLWMEQVVGVAKAYTTRVGMGPFPTEMTEEDAAAMRELGGEYGATTGRPRRCGWFDAALVRSSVRHNRANALIITKLDILDSFEELKICTGYRRDGRAVAEFDASRAGELEPVFVTMPGWRQPTGRCRRFARLPKAARNYIRRIEELCECPVAMISVGSDRDAMVYGAKTGVLKWMR